MTTRGRLPSLLGVFVYIRITWCFNATWLCDASTGCPNHSRNTYKSKRVSPKDPYRFNPIKLGILASSNSYSLVDAFLGHLLLFPFPIVEELVEYTISSVSTLLMMSSQSTIKLSLVSRRPVLSSDTMKTISFRFQCRWHCQYIICIIIDNKYFLIHMQCT